MEILNVIGQHYEEIIPYVINSGNNNYSTLFNLLDSSKYYGLEINAHFISPNEIDSLKLEYDNDINPLMCLDMAIHVILDKADVGLFNFNSMTTYIQEYANKSLIDNHVIDMLITGELFKIIKSGDDYKRYASDINKLIDFTFDFTKISNEFDNILQKQTMCDILLTLRGFISKVLKVRIENNIGPYFTKELNDIVFISDNIIRRLVLNSDEKFIKNSIIPVLNELYKKYDKIDLKFTNEDANYHNIIEKNSKIKLEISKCYLGVDRYFKYLF